MNFDKHSWGDTFERFPKSALIFSNATKTPDVHFDLIFSNLKWEILDS